MKIGLEPILSSLAVLGTVAYALGWLKTFYYFDAFGIGLPSVEMSVQDYLFESWFVIENLCFLILFWWIALKTRIRWVVGVAILYSFVPMAAHYAFAAHDLAISQALIHFRHTLLKVLPIAVLLLICLFHRHKLANLRELSWPFGRASLLLFVMLILAWAISTAKHFGSFDAQRAMLLTDQFLPSVQLGTKGDSQELSDLARKDSLYLLHGSKEVLLIWDRSGFVYGEGAPLRMLVLRRDSVEWVRTLKRFQLQSGSQFL